MESEFFKETLIILLLLFYVREQHLRRRKCYSIFQNRTCYENDTQRFLSKLGTSYCVIKSMPNIYE